jgi:ADP-ribosylation factor protein 1
MAQVLQKLLGAVFPRKNEYRALFLGLDASGRTTLLYLLKLGEVVTTIPTIGFNVETVRHEQTELTIWDVGGCDKIRPLWRHYFQNTQAMAYFVDMNDRARLNETTEELNKMLREDELRGVPVLMIFSKRDLPTGMSEDEIMERMNLRETLKGRQWRHVSTSSKDGASQQAALEALCELCEGASAVQLEKPPEKEPEVQLLRLAGTEIVVRQLADGSYENIETFDRVEIGGKKLEVRELVHMFFLLLI